MHTTSSASFILSHLCLTFGSRASFSFSDLICLNWYMYFSKLLHGFSKVVLEISSRLNFDLDLKACWSFCFGKKIQGRPLHPNTLGLSNWPFKCKDCIACYISKIIINTEWDIQYSQQNKVEKYKALKLPLFIWDGLNVFKSISTTIPTKSLLSNFHIVNITERHKIIVLK